MKKSQTLAALALAFALGVVVPVAGVSAFTVGSNANYGEATCGDVTSFINGLKADSPIYTYEAAAFEAAAKYTGKGALSTQGYDVDYSARTNIVAALTGRTYNYTPVTLSATGNTPEQIAKAIENARNITVDIRKDGQTIKVNAYTVWTNIFEGIRDVEAEKGTGRLESALLAAQDAYQDSSTFAANPTQLSLYKSMTNNPLTNSGTFQAFKTLEGKVNDAVKALDEYNTAISDLDAVVKAGDFAILTDNGSATDGRSQYDNIINQVAPAYPTVANYIALLNNNGGNNNWIVDRGNWLNVYNAVKTLNTDPCKKADTLNYTNMMTVASYYRTATWNRFANNDPYQIAQYLMGIKTENPSEDPTDTPSNGDDQKDPAAPGTGIVSTAEGNAATTVSIVAGLATALTALGAGVVAYRNARRSSEK